MKCHKIIIVLLFFNSALHSQIQKQVRVPIATDKSGKADTATTYKWLLYDIETMKLADLRYSQQPYHVRIWSDRNVIDISTNDKKNL
jgi:hypothetical protein